MVNKPLIRPIFFCGAGGTTLRGGWLTSLHNDGSHTKTLGQNRLHDKTYRGLRRRKGKESQRLQGQRPGGRSHRAMWNETLITHYEWKKNT